MTGRRKRQTEQDSRTKNVTNAYSYNYSQKSSREEEIFWVHKGSFEVHIKANLRKIVLDVDWIELTQVGFCEESNECLYSMGA